MSITSQFDDHLSFLQIEQQYPGTVKAGTLRVWNCTHRHGFNEIVTKFGRRIARVRRDRWEAFWEKLAANTSGAAK